MEICKVSEIDYAKGLIKVEFPAKDNIVSSWITFPANEYEMPEVGDLVKVEFEPDAAFTIVSSSELQIDVVQSADVLEAGTSSSRPQESESDSSEKETTEAETETPAQTREESSAG